MWALSHCWRPRSSAYVHDFRFGTLDLCRRTHHKVRFETLRYSVAPTTTLAECRAREPRTST